MGRWSEAEELGPIVRGPRRPAELQAAVSYPTLLALTALPADSRTGIPGEQARKRGRQTGLAHGRDSNRRIKWGARVMFHALARKERSSTEALDSFRRENVHFDEQCQAQAPLYLNIAHTVFRLGLLQKNFLLRETLLILSFFETSDYEI